MTEDLIRRSQSQDVLRAIAALSVFASHAYSTQFSEDLGQSGVRLFFMVSGYCIFSSINASQNSGIAHFIIRRIFRLYPAYWLSIFTAIALLGISVPGRDILANMTMAQRLLSSADIVSVYWTLFYEIIFYAVICMLLAVNCARSMAGVMIAIMAIIVIGIACSIARGLLNIKIPIAVFIYTATFLCGGALYFIRNNKLYLYTHTKTAPYALSVVIITFIMAMSYLVSRGEAIGNSTWMEYGRYSITSICVFVAGVFILDIKSRIISYIGKISYSIYLFHSIVIDFMHEWFSGVSLIFVSLVATLSIAAAVERLIEQPGIRLGRYCANRFVPAHKQ